MGALRLVGIKRKDAFHNACCFSADTAVCLKGKPTLNKGFECEESLILQDFQ